MSENLVATTARAITFVVTTGPNKLVTAIEVFPAGTEVYVRRIKNGTAQVRVAGTLFTQRVAVSQLLVP